MLNREWHETHRMPDKATLDQRIAWHVEHAAQCGCRDMPASIRAEVDKRGIEVQRKQPSPGDRQPRA